MRPLEGSVFVRCRGQGRSVSAASESISRPEIPFLDLSLDDFQLGSEGFQSGLPSLRGFRQQPFQLRLFLPQPWKLTVLLRPIENPDFAFELPPPASVIALRDLELVIDVLGLLPAFTAIPGDPPIDGYPLGGAAVEADEGSITHGMQELRILAALHPFGCGNT